MGVLQEHTERRKQRLARMHARAFPDTGIVMRNGWPVRRPVEPISPTIRVPRRRGSGSVTARLLPHWQFPYGPQILLLKERQSEDGELTIHEGPITVAAIITIGCKFFQVSRVDILSARRTQQIVRPRQILMYLARMLTTRSLPAIGRQFGGRDHTTILSAVKRVEILRTREPWIADAIERLTVQLKGGQ